MDPGLRRDDGAKKFRIFASSREIKTFHNLLTYCNLFDSVRGEQRYPDNRKNSCTMKKKEQKQEITRYSATVDPATKKVVEAMADGGVSKFRTPLYSSSTDGFYFWWNAWKHPGSGAWTVTRHTRLEGASANMVNPAALLTQPQENIAENLCYFDALYMLTHFQQGQNSPDVTGVKFPHEDWMTCTDAARQAKIPLDKTTGLPAPVAGGIILTNGDFDDAAHALAGSGEDIAISMTTNDTALALVKTNGPSLPPVLAAQTANEKMRLFTALNAEKEEIEQRQKTALAPLQEKQAAVQAMDHGMVQALETIGALDLAMRKSFGRVEKMDPAAKGVMLFEYSIGAFASIVTAATLLSSGFALLGPIFVAVAGNACGYIAYKKGVNGTFASDVFEKQLTALEQAAAQFPENSPERRALEDFNRAGSTVFALEHAAHLYQKKGPGNKKGLKILDKALQDMGVDDDTKQKIRATYNKTATDEQPGFPAPGTFLQSLQERFVTLQNQMNESAVRVLSDKPALPAPQ